MRDGLVPSLSHGAPAWHAVEVYCVDAPSTWRGNARPSPDGSRDVTSRERRGARAGADTAKTTRTTEACARMLGRGYRSGGGPEKSRVGNLRRAVMVGGGVRGLGARA
jgi:hypothetical protein